jgi:hypothetical protein
MKYTAPSILTTKSAGVAIQTGDGPDKNGIVLDSASPQMPSASAAYEADE